MRIHMAIVAAVLWSPVTWAQINIEVEPGSGDEYQTVVTARRRAQDPLEAPRSVSAVASERAQELLARSVPDLLDSIPGAFVQRTSAGAGLPFLRGLVGPDNLVLIDGIRYNNATFRSGPNQYLGLLQPVMFERLEVLRGPSSVLYGDGAMGGVVQLVTALPGPDVSRRMLIGDVAGSMGAADVGRALETRLDVAHGSLRATLSGAFGQYDDLRAGGGERQVRTGFRTGGGAARFRWNVRDDLVVDAAYLFSFLDDHERSDDLPKGDLRIYDNHDHLAYAKVRWHGAGSLRRIEAGLSWHRTRENALRFSCRLPGLDLQAISACAALNPDRVQRQRRYLDTVDSPGGHVEAMLTGWDDRLLITTGGDVYLDLVSSGQWSGRADDDFVMTPAERGNYTDGSRYLSLGGFVHAELTLIDLGSNQGRLVASGGPRISHFSAFAPDVPGLGDLSYAATGVVGGAALQWVRPGQWMIYASFDQGFRAPNLQETTVLGDTGDKFEIPNAVLGPQRSDTFEVGARIRTPWLDAGVAGFVSLLRDLIDEQDATWEGQSQVGGKNVKQRVNKQEGRYVGIEATAGSGWRNWQLDGSVSWVRGTVDGAEGETYPARRIPPVNGRVGLRWQHPSGAGYAEGFVRWAAAQDQLHPGDRQDLRICADPDRPGTVRAGDACAGTPGWATLNLLVGAHLGKLASLEIAALNLTDARYRLHGSGVLAAGLDVRARIRVRF